jgi:hypothetical protein
MSLRMSFSAGSLAWVLVSVSAFPAGTFAQTTPAHPPTTPGATAHPHQEPCWQVAGITKSAMQERRSIMEGVRSQVAAVCGDSSLTAQQRNEKIRAIHQQAKQQADAVITPQQMEAVKSCQASRGGGHPSGGAPHVGGGEPCGQLPGSSGSSTTAKPQPDNDLEN